MLFPWALNVLKTSRIISHRKYIVKSLQISIKKPIRYSLFREKGTTGKLLFSGNYKRKKS